MTDTETQPKSTWENKRYTPVGFEPAETPLQALIQAQFLLLDEERWVKGEWFNNHNPDLDPDDPFCNSWQVCAAGAVAIVTVGAARRVEKVEHTWDEELERYHLSTCPIPKEDQSWVLDFERDEYAAPAENVELYNRALALLKDGANYGQSYRYFSSVPNFNDDGMTSRQDVLKAFTHAIVAAAKAEAEAAVNKTVNEIEQHVKQRIKAQLDSALAVA